MVGCARAPAPASPTPSAPLISAAPTSAPAAGQFLPLVSVAPTQALTLLTAEAGPMPDQAASPAGGTQLFLPTVRRAPGPGRLIIPKLTLDVPVTTVPLEARGWAVDGLGEGVGWLAATGAFPGDALAPVLAGHVSQPSGASGPFGYLWRLRPGAEVFYDWDGRRYQYRVEAKLPVAEDAVEQVFLADGRRLLLLTCDGWDILAWEYTGRLLLSAVLETVTPSPAQ